MSQPLTAFDWEVYADATFAGLAALIPIPLVDWIFEEFFRRRMPQSIIKYRERTVAPAVFDQFNRRDSLSGRGCLRSCVTVPVLLTYGLLKRISRKILYFLTIKEATDKVNFYWHQAFLIDTMLPLGHLDNEPAARIARQAMDQLLEETNTSPLLQLAEQITTSARHILKTLRKAWRGQEDELVEQKKSQMRQQWADFDDYFEALAIRYKQTYQKLEAHQSTKAEAADDEHFAA